VKIRDWIALILVLGTLPQCSRKTTPASAVPAGDRLYDSEYPVRDISPDIAAISRTVKKVYNIVYYKTYQFRESSRITRKSLPGTDLAKESSVISIAPQTMSATATVIMDEGNRVSLLTCAHIFDFPDTIFTYGTDDTHPATGLLRSVAVSQRREIFVKDLPECGSFTLLAEDSKNDIALIGKLCEGKTRKAETFGYRMGNAKELRWGCLVYIMGYPLGTMTVTNGMVSNPDNDGSGSFTTDAICNKGSSGGIVLALRDGPPGFELVGMVRSAFSGEEYILRPEKGVSEIRYNENIPYQGDIHVTKDETISYGVTPIVPVESIVSFYKKNRDALVQQGYNLDGVFGIVK
jgi:hypothetical protein